MFTSGQIYHKKNISYVCYLFTDYYTPEFNETKRKSFLNLPEQNKERERNKK